LALGVLLDTHAFLWAITDDPRLSKSARHALETEELTLSVVSIWEIIIKVQIGKLTLPEAPTRYLPHISPR
jgi:PIN domain nuclease of toxin-antitoxin system